MAVIESVDPRAEVVRRRLRGQPYEEISAALGLDLDKVKDYFRSFLADNYSDLSEIEMRLTQLARLEKLVDFVWDKVSIEDFDPEGKHTANLLKVIEAINDVMALHRDPLRDAQVELTQVQTALVHDILTEVRTHLLGKSLQGVRSAIASAAAAGVEPAVVEHIIEASRADLEGNWSTWFAEASQASVERVRKIKEIEQ